MMAKFQSDRRSGLRALPWTILLWMIAILGGFTAIWSHASTPGKLADPIATLPPGLPIALHDRLPTLLVFIHPECPCSRATLAHLAAIVDRAAVSVVLVSLVPPAGDASGIGTSGCHKQLKTLSTHPLIHRVDDSHHELANRLGAVTSGDCFLYAPQGDLLFRGGITAARGHLGDNAGLQLLIDRLSEFDMPYQSYPVFGCPLGSSEPTR